MTVIQQPPVASARQAQLRAECGREDWAACTALGAAREGEADYRGAEEAWRKACEADHAEACHRLGNMLSNPHLKLGRGPDAVGWLRRSCDLKHVASCYFLGRIHDFGRHGVAADPVAARRLYRRGCDLGHHWACQKVGVGSVPAGGDCRSRACGKALWCVQDRCSQPPR